MEMAAAAGPVGAVVAAVVMVGKALYDTFISLSQAANPQAVFALNQAFDYLKAAVGQSVAPMMLHLGTAVVFAADLMKDLMPQIAEVFEQGGDTFEQTMTFMVRCVLLPFYQIELAAKALTAALFKAGEYMLYAVGWVMQKIGFKTAGKAVGEAGEWMGDRAKEAWNLKMPTQMLGEYLAKQIGGMSIGGKTVAERMDAARKKFAGSAEMGGEKATFESDVGAAYKRIQEAAAGMTPLEQETLDIQRRGLQAMLEIANNTGKRPPQAPPPRRGGS